MYFRNHIPAGERINTGQEREDFHSLYKSSGWFLFTMKVLDGSHERAMLVWTNSWISSRLKRMSKQGDSPNYECGGSCGSAKGA